MGYVQEARENYVKKKVEEGDLLDVPKYAEWVDKDVTFSDFQSLKCSTIALRSKMKQRALKECDHYTTKYAECAFGRTISVVWKCREQAKELNECLHQYTNDSVLEQMKEEYVIQHPDEGSLKG